MQEEEILSDAHKCLEYAFNHNHDCPEELRKRLSCKYHQKLEEEKQMKKTAEERQQEISDELVKKLKNDKEIKGVDDREYDILRLYYIEGKSLREIGEKVGLSKGYCGNLKQDALDKIKHNEDKHILVECSFDGCSREKKFIKGKEPNKWTCWQHEEEEKLKTMTKEEHEETHKSRNDVATHEEETIGIDYADQEKEDHILVMIRDGQAKLLKSDDGEVITMAGEAIGESGKFDEVVIGKKVG